MDGPFIHPWVWISGSELVVDFSISSELMFQGSYILIIYTEFQPCYVLLLGLSKTVASTMWDLKSCFKVGVSFVGQNTASDVDASRFFI